MKQTCHIVDQFCVAPPMDGESLYTKGECFCCGLPVCLKCSTKREYYKYGKVRLCNHCQIEYDGNDKIVMKRLYKFAGYKLTKNGRYSKI